MSNARNRKRPRTDNKDHVGQPIETSQGFTPDKEVYFADGNIDVIAERTAFRVHRGVLSAHSEVFQDMLSIPQPESTGHGHDVPIVEVTDAADEMRHLLLVLYYRNEDFRSQKPAIFGVASCLVRLAHKYQIQSVLDDAMGRIKGFYPSDLDDFKKVFDRQAANTALIHAEPDCMEVVKLARLVGDISLLPAAFYRCCQLSPSFLLGKQPDGTFSNSHRLPDEDIGRCMAGKAYLTSARSFVLHEMRGKGRSVDCDREDSCDQAFDNMLGELDLAPSASPHRWCNPFEVGDMPYWSEVLCGSCGTVVKYRLDHAEQTVWSTLPRVFDLKE
ncbi:uncharacterized protein C8Q71DRAFT_765924 [Rhodofomes roseus]|uniref:BTB domain-containing protein n=1 Tax=Rhodofomes roseus TaxID=34475 RepID=A0ABQ8KCX3_9APHY|nr:uncharacterized protein C8Q71DRAFT_765924 [Rhodofomes roseus]KAH9835448.1 hypothetical protein C8Q71DRAFT_765924 [Rhodofomes roseus]